jgi:hypothetical protein
LVGALLLLADQRGDAVLDRPQAHDERQLPVGAREAAGPHPARAERLADRCDRRLVDGRRRALGDQRLRVHHPQRRMDVELFDQLGGEADAHPLEALHARAVDEREHVGGVGRSLREVRSGDFPHRQGGVGAGPHRREADQGS